MSIGKGVGVFPAMASATFPHELMAVQIHDFLRIHGPFLPDSNLTDEMRLALSARLGPLGAVWPSLAAKFSDSRGAQGDSMEFMILPPARLLSSIDINRR